MVLPTVSILIPCFNGLPFVLEAVQSAIQQGEGGIECVVIDDGSTDGSAEAVAKRFGSNVRILRQPNRGVSRSRNRAFRESNGDLIIWLDADDLLVPNTLKLRRTAFAQDPELEMLIGRNEIFYMGTGRRELSPQQACDSNYFAQGLRVRNFPHLNALTFRRSSIVQNHFELYDPCFSYAADFDFTIRAWTTFKKKSVHVTFSNQRVGDYESMSSCDTKLSNYCEVEAVLYKNYELIKKHTGGSDLWRRAHAEWWADLSVIHLKQNFRLFALSAALRSILAHPTGPGLRTYKYLVEALLPFRLYPQLARALRRLAPPKAPSEMLP